MKKTVNPRVHTNSKQLKECNLEKEGYSFINFFQFLNRTSRKLGEEVRNDMDGSLRTRPDPSLFFSTAGLVVLCYLIFHAIIWMNL